MDMDKAPIIDDGDYEDMFQGKIISPPIQEVQRDADHEYYKTQAAISVEQGRREERERIKTALEKVLPEAFIKSYTWDDLWASLTKEGE